MVRSAIAPVAVGQGEDRLRNRKSGGREENRSRACVRRDGTKLRRHDHRGCLDVGAAIVSVPGRPEAEATSSVGRVSRVLMATVIVGDSLVRMRMHVGGGGGALT